MEDFGSNLFAFPLFVGNSLKTPFTLIVIEKATGLCLAAVYENGDLPGQNAPEVFKFIESFEAINNTYFNGQYVRIAQTYYPELNRNFRKNWNYIDANFSRWHIRSKAIDSDEFFKIPAVNNFNTTLNSNCKVLRKLTGTAYKRWLNSKLDTISDPKKKSAKNIQDHPSDYASELADYCVPIDGSWVISIKDRRIEPVLPDFLELAG
ncbi:MAG: hypothetical protein COY19_02505 [Candidatus Marinimicrobia bacterium CG_4_10_14_0_2_um_filter_48_9]|nr:MAG: hypothetical protein COY19_02505 [Candidatus Marinimicrobia bacterium CG_4_10_14_0_2_um_filter_48_9]